MGHGESEQLIVIATDRRDVWWATPKDEMEYGPEPQDGVEAEIKSMTKKIGAYGTTERCTFEKAKPSLKS